MTTYSYLIQKKREHQLKAYKAKCDVAHFEHVHTIYRLLVKTSIIFSLAETYKELWAEADSLVRENHRNLTIEMTNVSPN